MQSAKAKSTTSASRATRRAEANRYAVIEAPSILGLRPGGVEELPQALLRRGLATRVGARRADRLTTQPYSAVRDPQTQTLNASAIAEFSPRLADALERVLDQGEYPIVLGGDCSILLGSMLALRRRGRYGLLFIDGHADFYQPEVNPNGEAASMDLAFATGYGPPLLTDLEGRAPLVRSGDTVAFGFRDQAEQAAYESQPLPRDMVAIDLPEIRRVGAVAAAQRAIEHLTREPLDGFFIHVDADCLNDAVMPAVDYRIEEGLSWRELHAVLDAALSSGKSVGLELTIYNPRLDPTGSAGEGLTNVLCAALTGEGAGDEDSAR
jgi:arginase